MLLNFKPISENLNLVPDCILQLSEKLNIELKPMVTEIDKTFMGGKELCDHYNISPEDGANCVIVEVFKKEESFFVAIIVPVGYRADLNGIVKKHFDAKRVSLAPLEQVLKETEMEYGSITPFGLPSSYKILVDSKIMQKDKIIVGGGKQISKLYLPTKNFTETLGAEVIENLSNKI